MLALDLYDLAYRKTLVVAPRNAAQDELLGCRLGEESRHRASRLYGSYATDAHLEVGAKRTQRCRLQLGREEQNSLHRLSTNYGLQLLDRYRNLLVADDAATLVGNDDVVLDAYAAEVAVGLQLVVVYDALVESLGA